MKHNFSPQYWRTKSKAEVDFVINDKIPIEVKSRLSGTATGKSLRSFVDKYCSEHGYVLNENIFDSLKLNTTTFHFYLSFFSKHMGT
jgi:predicted AAA+ superfamily ATPase